MLIRKVGISKTGPIREPVELEFDPHVNVLIGPNACGKTTVLNILRRAESGVDFDDPRVNVHDDMLHQGVPREWHKVFESFVLLPDGIDYVLDSTGMDRLEEHGYQPCRSIPVISVPSIRLTFPTPDEVASEYTFQDAFVETHNILDFRHVFRMQDEYEKLLSEAVQTGDGLYVGFRANPEVDTETDLAHMVLQGDISISDDPEADREWAEDTIRRSWGPDTLRARKQAVIALADQCTAQICGEIMQDEPATTYEYKFREGLEPRGVTGLRYDHWGVFTTDATDAPLTIGDLSSGTQGPLMWIRYVALMANLKFVVSTGADRTAHFRDRSPWEIGSLVGEIREASREHAGVGERRPELWKLILDYGSEAIGNSHQEWRKMPFVLLIDEIENHLHPTWQRRIIPALSELFPNAQIFATTHSPFVVAGLKAGQVHLLNRDANGVVTATTNSEDIVGWTADEILRTMMGVEDPTDDATAAAARELRQLRSEGPRDTEVAEAARQARMQELRRSVDRDLLAGGPAAAQRELFEQQFAEALEKYRQSQDLGQENG